MTEAETAWLAGILEGEGWIGFRHGARFEIAMTDEDVIARVSALVGRQYIARPAPTHSNQPFFRVTVCGRPAAAILRQVRPWMGQRRGARIDEVLAPHDKCVKCAAERCENTFPAGSGKVYCGNPCAQWSRRRGRRSRQRLGSPAIEALAHPYVGLNGHA